MVVQCSQVVGNGKKTSTQKTNINLKKPILGNPDGLDKSPTPDKKLSIFTVKVTTANLIALSKFLATIKAQFKPLNSSRIFVSPETRAYYAFLNFTDTEIAEKLQEVSPFPEGA